MQTDWLNYKYKVPSAQPKGTLIIIMVNVNINLWSQLMWLELTI